QDMPPFRGKITADQARGLVGHVRAFAPTARRPGQEEKKDPAAGSFDDRYRRLQEEMDELQRQFRQMAKDSPDGKPSKPSESQPQEAARPGTPGADETPVVRELFQQRCVKCHATDGTGSRVRERLPEVPDFTDGSWQARRTDDRLLASILDGKGEGMPPFRG